MQDHWAKTGFDLMTGVIIFVLVSDELDALQRNLSTVQAILSDGGPVRELAERLAADKDTDADEKAKIAEGFRAVMEYIRDTGYEKWERAIAPTWKWWPGRPHRKQPNRF